MTLPLRFPRLWVTLGWVFVVAASVASLLPGGTPGLDLANDKVEHIAGYAGLTLWFAGIYPRSRYWLIALGLLTMGIVMEFAQGWMHMGRQRDFADVIANSTGIAVGMLLALTILGGWMQKMENWIAPRKRRNS